MRCHCSTLQMGTLRLLRVVSGARTTRNVLGGSKTLHPGLIYLGAGLFITNLQPPGSPFPAPLPAPHPSLPPAIQGGGAPGPHPPGE